MRMNLLSFLKREVNLFIVFTVFSLILGGIFSTFLLSEKKKEDLCHGLKSRLHDLNDIFAREIILDSPQTLQFELRRIESDLNLQSLSFIPEDKDLSYLASKCSFLGTSNTMFFSVKLGEKTLAIFVGLVGTKVFLTSLYLSIWRQS